MTTLSLIATDKDRRRQSSEGLENAQKICKCLLIGPYDPKCGEYTFLAPPLGVWRLAGAMEQDGHGKTEVRVFDPNCCEGSPESALARELQDFAPDMVGVSTTGMTLKYDLALAHQVRRHDRDTLIIAGGMEATFQPDLMFSLGPFDIVVLGEGENPMRTIVERWRSRESYVGVPGSAIRQSDGAIIRFTGPALDTDQLSASIAAIPYERMPYPSYWKKLESAYSVGSLPHKAEREARLSEIRSVRLITLNYCPMGCSFCSSTNFLHAAQGKVTKVTRLTAQECVAAIDRILDAQPETRTIIFQDDIFVFTKDDRILPLCELIKQRKINGRWKKDLRFISTNRIDAMSTERLSAMYDAGFRILGFGIESFSLNILKEFNKRLIYKHIGPNLRAALAQGITPFLDLIMSSPRCSLEDVASNVRHAHFWLEQGCEVGMYPFVIPFSGAAMSEDETLTDHYEWEEQNVSGTETRWQQPARILPIDPDARSAMLAIETHALGMLEDFEKQLPHIPSRIRSLAWILSACKELSARNIRMPPVSVLEEKIDAYRLQQTRFLSAEALDISHA